MQQSARKLSLNLLVGACLFVAGSQTSVAQTPASQLLPRLVFGSFSNEQNASAWADKMQDYLGVEVVTQAVRIEGRVWHRVVTAKLNPAQTERVVVLAERQNISHWTLRGLASSVDTLTSSPQLLTTPNDATNSAGDLDVELDLQAKDSNRSAKPAASVRQMSISERSYPIPAAKKTNGETVIDWGSFDVDLSLQTRMYKQQGFIGQDRFQPSVSLEAQWSKSWNDDQQSIHFKPFLRWDSKDDDRSHADIRELYWSHVGNDWEFHLGAKQIFWGVTEFNHLVDIINQTDFAENIDGEDKLGQPMVHLSLVRDWGILDFYLLAGFRERTYPGEDGRLRLSLAVDNDAQYESSAESQRVDAAVRWSHFLGPINFGVYHFSGTSRDPQFAVVGAGLDRQELKPMYNVIDQTGVDAQLISGDWAFKLEAISRSGDGDRYSALTAGIERTLVGVLGSRADLGAVLEYMFDDRGEDAYNTYLEHDVAVGVRWLQNDVADTQALIGAIWDVETHEYVFSVEASRRMGDWWQLILEARLFGGGEELTSADLLQNLVDAQNKTGALQRDDLIQLELTRYF